MTTPSVPDLAAVEAYHAAVIAAIPLPCACEWRTKYCDEHGHGGMHDATFRALADRVRHGLRRHDRMRHTGEDVLCRHCEFDDWPCPDALAWWSVLTGIGTTYGVTA